MSPKVRRRKAISDRAKPVIADTNSRHAILHGSDPSDLVVLCVTFGGLAFQALLRILVKSCSISVPGILLEVMAIQVEPRANKDLH